MKLKVSISQQGIILAFVPLMFQVVFTAILINAFYKEEHKLDEQLRLQSLVEHQAGLEQSSTDYVTYASLYSQHGGANLEQKKNIAFLKIKEEVSELKRLSQGNLHLNQRCEALEHKFDKLERSFTRFNRDKKLLDKGETPPDSGQLFLLCIRKKPLGTEQPLEDYSKKVQHIEERYSQLKDAAEKNFYAVIGTGIFLSIFISVALALGFNRNILSRLSILNENASRMTLHLPLHNPVKGSDEIALLDQNFHSMESQSKAADAQKKHLLLLASESLKVPLQRSVYFLTLAQENEQSNTAIQKKLLPIRGNLLRLCSLIQDLLDIQNVESGKMELSLSSCQIKNIIASSLSAVQNYQGNKNLNFSISESDATIIVDALKLEQVLINFISNAIKFSPPESTISITVEPAADNLIEIAVTDQGDGISEAKLSNLFERFSQTNPEADTKIGGSGLGLSICKTITEAHGGRIGASSVIGSGSRFWIKLPLPAKEAHA